MKRRVLLKDIQNNELYPRPCMPIGSVIFLNNTLDPNTYFMGTWQKIEEEVFFMTASNNFPVGQVSGSNTHTLTVEELPVHSHTFKFGYGYQQGGSGGNYAFGASDKQAGFSGVGDPISNTGGGQSFDVRPRRYTINAWVRIS